MVSVIAPINLWKLAGSPFLVMLNAIVVLHELGVPEGGVARAPLQHHVPRLQEGLDERDLLRRHPHLRRTRFGTPTLQELFLRRNSVLAALHSAQLS